MDSQENEIYPYKDLEGEDFWRAMVENSVPRKEMEKYGRVPGNGYWAMRYRMQFLHEDDE